MTESFRERRKDRRLELALPLEVLTQLKELGAGLPGPGVPRYGPNPWLRCQYLFCGPPASGRLLAAQLIARDLGVALWRHASADLMGRYIGETEKNLARVFERAADTGWVLYFDQADALFGRPGGVDNSNSRYGNQAVAYLLRRAEAYRGVVILSTQARPYLDGPATSRIDRVVDFPRY